MLVSWNLRGFNKVGKIKDISSILFRLQPEICILIETRVKLAKESVIRKKLSLHNSYVDNYSNHENGRIWVSWNSLTTQIEVNSSTDQYIHRRVNDPHGKLKFNMTVVYALISLNRRRQLWLDIEKLAVSDTEPWCIIGYYNNVLSVTP